MAGSVARDGVRNALTQTWSGHLEGEVLAPIGGETTPG